MIFEIYEGYTEEGNGSRKYAINPKLFKEEEEGHYPKPEDWFEPRFSHNITKLGEIVQTIQKPREQFQTFQST